MEPVAGCDPHLDTLELVVIDGLGRLVTGGTVPNSATGWEAVTQLVADCGVATVGIENASGYGAGLARHLTASGIGVADVPTRITAQRRRRSGSGKSDRGDARLVAEAVLAGAGNQWRNTPDLEVLRLLAHRRRALVRDQTRDINQLRALLVHVDPAHAAHLGRLRSTRAFTNLTNFATPHPHHQIAAELIRTLAHDCARRLDQIRHLQRQLAAHLPPSGHQLINTIEGCGTITAATLLAELAGTDGFATDAKFATWAGAAPLDASSGRTQDHHRLNRGGNRQANQALHTIIITQLRHGGPAAHYIHRRRTEGLTHKAAIRAAKRHLARRIWKTLQHHPLT